MRFLFAALVATLFCCQSGTGTAEQALGGSDDYGQCEDTCGPQGNKSLVCHYPPGNEENMQTLCVGSHLVPDHLEHGDNCGECELPSPECGDGLCEAPEDCSSCPGDCGACPPVCGDQVCEGAENCSTCAVDCGTCPPVCGDQACDKGENCESCANDCGVCSPVCGDASCDEGESCENCEADCGECPGCPPECGNQVCEDGETCSSCPRDCGECEPVCGDSVCEGREDCKTCPTDCGTCPPDCGNEICEVGEDCEVCEEDCEACPAPCGNGVCDDGEGCVTCPGDCGLCTAPDAGPTEPGSDAGEATRTTITGGELAGCNAGRGTGLFGLFFVGIAFLFWPRKKRTITFLATLVMLFSVQLTAQAQVAGDPGEFKLERFDMAMDGNSIITVESADVGIKGSSGLHFFLGYANDPLVLQEDTGDGWHRAGSLVGDQVSGSFGLYHTLFDDLAVGITIPVVVYQGRDAGDITGLGDMRSFGMSDPRFMFKYQLAGQTNHIVNAAVGTSLTFPWPTNDQNYINDNSVTFAPYIALSRDYDSKWRWAANAGLKFRRDSDIVDLDISDEVFARLGIAKGWDTNEVGVTVSSNTAASDVFTDNTSYTEFMAQYSRKYDSGWSSFMGTGTGLNQGFGAPDWRVFAGLRFDADGPAPVTRTAVEVVVPPEEEEPQQPQPEPEEVKLMLTVPDAFFKFDQAEVLPQYRSKLQAFATQLTGTHRDHPELDIFAIIVGHTDSIGPEKYNLDLAERRANAVMQVLIEAGAPRELLQVHSFGETKPVASNSTAQGRATNRRVEVYLGGNEGTLEYYDIQGAPTPTPDDKETYDSFGNLKID